MEIIDTGVLVVGAGPTGLALSNILGQAGVATVLIDRKASTVGEPRAVSIDDESLRTMQAIGLAADVLQDVVSGYGVHYFTRPGGRCFGKVEPTASEYGFPRRNAFRQPLFEATLHKGLERFDSVKALFGHRLESFTDRHDSVEACIKRDDGTTVVIRARYLVGCDGGRSAVREMLGIELSGTTFKSRWLVIDTENDDDPFWQTRVYCDARRPIVEVPGPHRTRRFEFLIHPHEDAEAVMQPENVQEFLRPFRGDKPTDIVRKVVYTFHARMADRWRDGNVFLAGDAAHLTPPYAGQGMNSGVRDAHNLGWKLAMVMRERLPGTVLDSYAQERRGHAWALIRLALNLGVVMAPRTRIHAAFFHLFFTLAGYVAPLRDYFAQMKFKPKPRYERGLLGSEEFDTGARGAMFPQPAVTTPAGEERLLDEIIGHRFALVGYGADAVAVSASLQHPLWCTLDAVRIAILPRASSVPAAVQPGLRCVVDKHGAMHGLFQRHEGRIFLLRPDRYIAGAFLPEDEERFGDSYETTLFGAEARREQKSGSERMPAVPAA